MVTILQCLPTRLDVSFSAKKKCNLKYIYYSRIEISVDVMDKTFMAANIHFYNNKGVGVGWGDIL